VAARPTCGPGPWSAARTSHPTPVWWWPEAAGAGRGLRRQRGYRRRHRGRHGDRGGGRRCRVRPQPVHRRKGIQRRLRSAPGEFHLPRRNGTAGQGGGGSCGASPGQGFSAGGGGGYDGGGEGGGSADVGGGGGGGPSYWIPGAIDTSMTDPAAAPSVTITPGRAASGSQVHAVIQVETSPAYGGDTVNISSSQLQASCGGTITFETLQGGSTIAPRTSVNSISVFLDGDGNVTVVVDGRATRFSLTTRSRPPRPVAPAVSRRRPPMPVSTTSTPRSIFPPIRQSPTRAGGRWA